MNHISLFTIISAILALSAMIKVFFGIFFHKGLYEFAYRHYNRKRRSYVVNLLLVYAVLLCIAVWIATIFFYVPYGWILTTFITIASLKSLSLLFSWEKSSQAFVSFIEKRKNQLYVVDIFVGLLGLGFLFLTIWVY